MKKITTGFIAFLFIAFLSQAQQTFTVKNFTSPDGKYTYSMVENDPLKVRTYVLKNGLTVIMSVNKKEPRIQTYIATKAGSKNDPADNTGLAHYLEHMLFKGTDTYGTKSWAEEKIQLDKIDALYEQYNKTTDEAARKHIYHQIDSVSGVASKYAIANEYDKLMQVIGAQGTNAFTSLEQTVYVNDIPQNNIDKWIRIEAERFRNPILRLFHTELEAVYEEKNISLDNDNRKVFEALMTGLFKNHTYGTQTTIGTVEHLKNPSLIKIRNYYNTYYVPNNMAIVLAGDFDPDQTIALIDKNFAYMTPKPVPPFTFSPEDVRTAPEVVNVYGPDAENLMIGFRVGGANSRDAMLVNMIDMLLSNSKAGLIDLNLVKKQAVLGAGSQSWNNKDYSILMLMGKAKKDQKLEEVKDLLIAQIEKIKNGEFDDNTLAAIIANLKLNKIRERESNDGRASLMLDAFTSDRKWQDVTEELSKMSKITRKELIDFAKKNLQNDYVIIYKRAGEDKSIKKIAKPEITPVQVNREDVSPFVKSIIEEPSPKIQPRFVDFNKDLSKGKYGYAPIYYVQNKENGLFSLYYVLDMGKFHDLKLPMAVNLLPYLGTDKYTAAEISKAFFRLACDFSVNVSNEQVYVSLSGLDENFKEALNLFEHLLANAKPDQAALNQLTERILKGREDAKKSKGTIFRSALQNYAVYGTKNPFKHELNEEQLHALKAEELVGYLKSLSSYNHKIWYFGPQSMADLTKSLSKEHILAKTAKAYPQPVVFTRQETTENRVFFTNYDMVQAEIMWINKSFDKFDSTMAPEVAAYNEYFGGGMSSVVFQTIRESKALAYSTYSRFNSPSKKNDPYYNVAYIGTQADKLAEAVPAMNDLLNNMPMDANSYENAIASLANSIETSRTNDANIIFAVVAAEKLGLHHDINEDIYKALPKIGLKELASFHDKVIKNKTYTYCVMGSKDKLKTADLEKYGKVQEVDLKEIFGY